MTHAFHGVGGSTAAAEAGSQPALVAIFCPTFLKPEMLHVYRQVAGLRRVLPSALAFKRENADHFPFAPVHLLPRSPWRGWQRVWQRQIRRHPLRAYPSEVRAMEALLARLGARLLHIYFGNNALFWEPLLQRRPVPTVVSFHGADVRVGLGTVAAKRRLQLVFANVDRVLARSDSLADALRRWGCPPDKLRVQRTGVPLTDYPACDRVAPADGGWRWLQACRLVEKKGLEVTLRAYARFRTRWPQATLTIAGDGPLKTSLKARAKELGVLDGVAFTGFLAPAALQEAYRRAHLFLHPSETGNDGNQEGIPNSLLEAMATGLPVLATRHGGIPEAVADGVNGCLVAEGDADGLADAALKLAVDDAHRAALGAAAASTVREGFDLERQLRRLEEVYLELIG